jgi:hypothetical protein
MEVKTVCGGRSFKRALALCLLSVGLSLFLAREARAYNPIEIENNRAGTGDWKIPTARRATNHEIEGFASSTSVNKGGQISLYINLSDAPHNPTPSAQPNYQIEVFRLGWYGGLGGRSMLSQPIQLTGKSQGACSSNSETGLEDCSNWTSPYVLNVLDSWVSGVYVAKLTLLVNDLPTGKQSYIIWTVRDDARASDILFQSSVTTFQAYNNWGCGPDQQGNCRGSQGKSLYGFNSSNGERAYKVSFNRPYADGTVNAVTSSSGQFLREAGGYEYPMVRWLERNGYDVTYSTDVDTHQSAASLLNHKAFLSVGHDEYWSWEMRHNVEQARDSGVNVGFFSGNTCYWQIRFENSDRTMVCYKPSERLADDSFPHDPNPTEDPAKVTDKWGDEDALIGVRYEAQLSTNAALQVKEASHWVFAGTGMAEGDTIAGLVGYEVDRIQEPSNAPSSLVNLAQSPLPAASIVAGSAEHPADTNNHSNATIYTADSGALVFASGTIEWSSGLDDFSQPGRVDCRAQTITHNILARFTGRSFTTQPAPQTVFNTQVPDYPDKSDGGAAPYELGMKFRPDVAGQVKAIRYWKSASDTGTHVGHIWRVTGTGTGTELTPQGGVQFSDNSGSGWKEVALTQPINITPGETYVVSVNSNGFYPQTVSGLAAEIVNGGLRTVAGEGNGVASLTTGAYPNLDGYQSSNYFRDVVFVPSPQSIDGRCLFGPQAPDLREQFTSVPYELGMKFRSDVAGQVTAIRYWKSPLETGTHVGHIWQGTATDSIPQGTELTPQGGVQFSADDSDGWGWKTVLLPRPVDISPGVTYVVSVNTNFFYTQTVSGLADEVVNGPLKSVDENDGSNGVISSTLGTFPQGPAYQSSNYFRDVVFVPSLQTTGSQSVFGSQTPTYGNKNDVVNGGDASYELGMRFRSDVAGQVTAIRYWKAPDETGIHVGHIWSDDGEELRSVVFTDDGGSGWKVAVLRHPLDISPGVTYVVSVNLNHYYVQTVGGLSGSVVNGHLMSATGSNGVAGLTWLFPQGPGYEHSNYFRDIVFVPSP